MEDAQPGHTVEFHGLKGAAHLNGTSGHLVKFLRDEQRWAVRCESNYEIVNAKPENLKRLNIRSEKVYFEHPITGQTMVPRTNNPVTAPTTQIDDFDALHKAVLQAFYNLRKGGVVVSCGDRYMIAIEFDGPVGQGGVCGEMTFVDNDKKAQAVVKGRECAEARELGRNFLAGEATVYYNTSQERVFFDLLQKYKRGASSKGLIDMKSGLPIFDVTIRR
ncbi:unnamed protein product [Cylindrotheca closterium]|uniref:Uncharacterized protein n=1 Tax=Cylindrotheca closterium TaxID=2856 RepID=A0AAD2G2U0_9STRA|nr:unnamed protein product [Cylindrotheca closterium]